MDKYVFYHNIKIKNMGFLGDPVAKILCFHCREHGLTPDKRNNILYVIWQKYKESHT